METATKLIVESTTKRYTATLRNPLTIGEIWAHFVARGKRPAMVTLANHVARVQL